MFKAFMFKAIFFDAGGTLIFADREKTLAPLAARGISFTQEQLHSAERAARHFRDQCAASESRSQNQSRQPTAPDLARNTDEQYWSLYYQTLLGDRAADARLVSELIAASRSSANWTFVPPEVPGCLAELKQQYRLAVISNSDGKILDLFRQLGLAEYFETIVDSGQVGYQKPSPVIFETALKALGVAAADSLYVGDVYSIDYTGARGAGMQAVLVDPYGTYRDNGVARVESICDLKSLLFANTSLGR
jgi:putative hydrolase of the HAD superfamily